MTIALAWPPTTTTIATPAAAEVLARLEDLQAELEQPELSLHDALRARTTAETLRAYATAALAGKAAVLRAAELRIVAERRAGQLLMHLVQQAGPVKPDRSRRRAVVGVPDDQRLNLPSQVIAELGIRVRDSSRWQMLARIPEPEFEQRLAAARAAERMPSVTSFLRAAHQFARGRNGRTTSTTSLALARALKIVAGIKTLRTRQEVSYGRQILAVVETWDAEVQNRPRRTDWQAPREVSCLLCGRPRPASRPSRCEVCGGDWLTD